MLANVPETWSRAPEHVSLPPNEAHVWRLVVDDFLVEASSFTPLLSEEEAARASRFVRESDRRRFTITRAVLRTLIGRYLRRRPVDLELIYGPRGKPSLKGDGAGLSFNISHSGTMALFALAENRELGVDIEWERRDVDVMVIVDRFFSHYEVARLRELPPELWREAFYRGWVRKEAYIKARGEGLSIPLHSFDVTVFPDRPLLLRVGDNPAEPDRWSFYELTPGQGYAGMLVAEGQLERVGCYEFEPGTGDQ